MPKTCIFLGIGKLDNWIRNEILRYGKMVNPYFEFIISYQKSGQLTKDINKNKLKEAELIRKSIPEKSYTISLAEEGKIFNSIGFSKWINNVMNKADIFSLIIGGAYGLHQSIKNESNYLLSLSPLTFSHLHCPLILAEQIYRATTIINGHPYHK
jgi:23S rRNA (pseudouridine1915-N3)-methyltransferase